MRLQVRLPQVLVAVAAAAFGSVGIALYTQHGLGMLPCPWCVLQRLIFVLIALAAGLGLLWRSRLGGRVGALLALVLADLGAITALWQHFVAAASASCNLTFADRVMGATGLDRALPQVFAAYASCADAAVSLLGVPYEFGSLALFILINGLMLRALIKPR